MYLIPHTEKMSSPNPEFSNYSSTPDEEDSNTGSELENNNGIIVDKHYLDTLQQRIILLKTQILEERWQYVSINYVNNHELKKLRQVIVNQKRMNYFDRIFRCKTIKKLIEEKDELEGKLDDNIMREVCYGFFFAFCSIIFVVM